MFIVYICSPCSLAVLYILCICASQILIHNSCAEVANGLVMPRLPRLRKVVVPLVYIVHICGRVYVRSLLPRHPIANIIENSFEDLCKFQCKSKCKSDGEINVRCYANRESKCKHHGKKDFGAMRMQMQMQIYPSGRLNVSSFL